MSLIVCPTSLLYNWKEEFAQIQSEAQSRLSSMAFPPRPQKIIEQIDKYDVMITSYTLLQKDIETLQDDHFQLRDPR